MTATSAGRARLVPMAPRDPHEHHRAASSLELFFDLVFVVAVSVAAVALHHDLTEDHVGHGVLSYLLVFFAIWWAWMNFTWFASSFDTDDWLYRVVTVVQMGGVLVLAAGVEPAFEDGDFALVTLGYVVMRVAMVTQWLRAARDTSFRTTARRYAVGIVVVQVGWVLRLLLPEELGLVSFLVLAAADVAVPLVAERTGMTPWHPHHIAERYGLFTLILLGESLLGSANAVFEALHADEDLVPLIAIASLALVITASLWWIYFWPAHHAAVAGRRGPFTYGYGHYLVFAAAGAISAGIEVAIDAATDHTELGAVAAAYTLAVPVVVFVLGVWALAMRGQCHRRVDLAVLAGCLALLLVPLTPAPVPLTAVVLIAIVAVLVLHPAPNDDDHEVAAV